MFEADVDWDVRVKNFLSDIALASEAVLSSPADHPVDLSEVTFSNTVAVSPYVMVGMSYGWDIVECRS